MESGDYNNRYHELARKWRDGTISDEEIKEFADWFNSGEDVEIPVGFSPSEENLRRRILKKIRHRKSIAASKLLIRLAAASVLFGVIISSFYFLQNRNVSEPIVRVESQQAPASPIVPGGNKAVLTLADGSTIVLDSAATGTIAEDKSKRIVKVDDGEISYSATGDRTSEVKFNTLVTPRGGQYSITLADGTRVWLNSTSSLKFPTAFGHERMVEITGEVYFEVARNKVSPFKVKVNDMVIQVLGTHFNVMAYHDEPAIRTTLLEGSVKISGAKGSALLRPGDQARMNDEGFTVVKNVNVDQVISWKNGQFNFKGTNIQGIMRQLARWYNIDVEYKGKINHHFNGTISKNVGIDKVFTMLEHTGVVDFRIDFNRITVSPAK